jgi:hypothetical protein
MAPGVLWPQPHRNGFATAGCPLIGAEYLSSGLVFSFLIFWRNRNLVQSGAIWCNLVQFLAGSCSPVAVGLHLLSSKLHLLASRLRLGTEMGRLFDPQVSL